MKHLNRLLELTAGDVNEIFAQTAGLKANWSNGLREALLPGRVLAQVFDKPSLRTRVSFESAMAQLGGHSIFLTSKEAGLQGRESLEDVARVLTGYCDVVVLRTFSQATIDEFVRQASCPVVNGLSDEFHPCQALTDLFTMREVFGSLAGKRLAFVGDGNNVAASLAVASALSQVSMTICSPASYQLNGTLLADLKQRLPNADVTQTDDPLQAVRDADVVYTDVWASMGQESEADLRKQVFAPYQVNGQLMSAAPASCRFMHCLPAHRGLEVTDDVLDGPQSLVFQQAENRMHLAKGLLVWLLT